MNLLTRGLALAAKRMIDMKTTAPKLVGVIAKLVEAKVKEARAEAQYKFWPVIPTDIWGNGYPDVWLPHAEVQDAWAMVRERGDISCGTVLREQAEQASFSELARA
ncbi:hypothetical protein VTI74DRAFT_5214 [Chaetomium olivicolor]